MRILVGLLLLANLAFFSWARWIAPGTEPPADPLKPAVPRLLLARELPAPAGGAPAPASAPAGEAAPVLQCVSIGPFPAAEQALQAAQSFRGDGYTTAQREEQGEEPDGFWVFIGPIATEAEQQRIVRRMRDKGVPDAKDIHRPGQPLEVSAGIFSERARAARRAAEVSRLGFKPEVAEHRRTTATYWLDLSLSAGHPGLQPEELDALNKGGGKLGVKPCTAPAPAGPAGSGPAAGPEPSVALPAAPAAPDPAPAPAPVAAERRAWTGPKMVTSRAMLA